MSGNAFLAAALEADAAGISVCPAEEDGSKKGLGSWGRWQRERPSRAQFEDWYVRDRRTGLFYVSGRISGGMEMLECESLAAYHALKERAREVSLGDVLDSIEAGWSDLTPGGGLHLHYRCDEIAGNTRLACRPKRPEEKRHEKDDVQVLIETRGEGGGSVGAPSNGTVHPTGRAYRRHLGGPSMIATITPGERADLFALARTFDEMPRETFSEPRAGVQGDGSRPGDDFNARGDPIHLLLGHDWTVVYSRGDTTYLRRPGKDRGISASVGYKGTRYFYPFTSSTAFTPMRAYSPFAVYATLEHGGDFAAAAKALAAQGYGGNDDRGGNGFGGTDNTDKRTSGSFGSASETPARLAGETGNGAFGHTREEGDAGLPAFPVDAFPGAIARYVEEGAEALNVPPDMIALPILGFAAGAIGNSAAAVVKPTWIERPNLWLAIIGDPGSGKSPAADYARAPLDALQRETWERYRVDLAQWEQEVAEAKAEKGRTDPLPEKPALEHFFTTDATTEALASILTASPGVAVTRDELVGWVKSHDAYRKAGDRQAYLSLWAGHR